MLIKNKSVVLFQGDSITDAGRDRGQYDGLGDGYAMIAAGWFFATHPEEEVIFLNRGIGGDRTRDLCERWTRDCIELHPSIVSILIGINDCWRKYDSNDPTSVEQFESNYREIMQRTKDETEATIILMDPFLLEVSDERRSWREDLDPKREVVHKLAEEFRAHYIPLDEVFKEHLRFKEPAFWAADGVHPSFAGHALIAKQFLEMVDTH